jgi:hypothetical protein
MSSDACAWTLGGTVHPGIPTVDAEIEILKSLHLSAAAFLVGLSPRAFRDRVEVPRNRDGTFNAQNVCAHFCDNENLTLSLIRDSHWGAIAPISTVAENLGELFAGILSEVEKLPARPTKNAVIRTVVDAIQAGMAVQKEDCQDDDE